MSTPGQKRLGRKSVEVVAAKAKAAELIADGLTNAQVAKRLGRTPRQIRAWKSEIAATVKAAADKRIEGVAEAADRAKSHLVKNAVMAAKRVVGIARNGGKDELTVKANAVSLRAAFGILDRVGVEGSGEAGSLFERAFEALTKAKDGAR